MNVLTFTASCFPGKRLDLISTLTALQDAKEIVKTFWKSSGNVPSALSALDGISKKLQPQVTFKVKIQKPKVMMSRVALIIITY